MRALASPDIGSEAARKTPPNGRRARTTSAASGRNPVWHRIALGVQAKLDVAAPGDAYEEEADQVADQVMRMPDPAAQAEEELPGQESPPVIQRRCTRCEDEMQRQPQDEEGDLLRRQPADEAEDDQLRRQPESDEEARERLQAKGEPGGRGRGVPDATETRVRGLRGGGQPLGVAERAFFEPRLGHDLDRVRVHADAAAASTATALRAQAYTHGPDLVFAPGRYAPDTASGRHLLAHELTHSIQQGAAPRLSSRGSRGGPTQRDGAGTVHRFTPLGSPTLQRTPEVDEAEGSEAGAGGGSVPACDQRESTPILWFQRDSTLLRSDRRVNSSVHLAMLIRRVRDHLDLAGGLGHARLTGYASHEGTASHNLDLSQRRADTAASLLRDAGIPRTSVTAVGRGEDRSFPGLEMNRRVETCLRPPIEVIHMPPETVEGDVVDCTNPPSPVPSLAAYASLIACIEAALPTIGPRDMLDLLRRAYYGGRRFNQATGCTTMAGLVGLSTLRTGHPDLYASLMASKVVSGVDLGHVFTGLEGMVCPTATTRVTATPLDIDVVTAMPNEEFLTWGGDLGSAAAMRTHDEIDNGVFHGPNHYFGTPGSMASYEDLRGDIDSFVIRAELAGRCAGSRMTALPALTAPMSQLLLAYYSGVGAHSMTDRFRCFVEAIGGRISGGRITNKRALVSAMVPRVESFARNFYLAQVSVPLWAIGVREGMALFGYSHDYSTMFVDWLESQL